MRGFAGTGERKIEQAAQRRSQCVPIIDICPDFAFLRGQGVKNLAQKGGGGRACAGGGVRRRGGMHAPCSPHVRARGGKIDTRQGETACRAAHILRRAGGKIHVDGRRRAGGGAGRQADVRRCGFVAQQRRPGQIAAFQKHGGRAQVRQAGQGERARGGGIGLKAQRRSVHAAGQTQGKRGGGKERLHIGGAQAFRDGGGETRGGRRPVGGVQRQIKGRMQPVG